MVKSQEKELVIFNKNTHKNIEININNAHRYNVMKNCTCKILQKYEFMLDTFFSFQYNCNTQTSEGALCKLFLFLNI